MLAEEETVPVSDEEVDEAARELEDEQHEEALYRDWAARVTGIAARPEPQDDEAERDYRAYAAAMGIPR